MAWHYPAASITRAKPTHENGRLKPLRFKPRVALVHGVLASPCWLIVNQRERTHSTDSNAYRTLALQDGTRIVAHRWAWAAANRREVPEGMVVHHRCFRGSCINPAHIAIATLGENSALSDFDLRRARAHLRLVDGDDVKAAA